MAIHSLQIDWLLRLKKKGVFEKRTSMLELGPQDFMSPVDQIVRTINNSLGAGAASDTDFVENGNFKPYAQAAFYAKLGVPNYTCVDLSDKRSHHHVDLNKPITVLDKKYDVITNFGTAEHVFNIPQVFMSIHDLLADDGVVLHILPAMADINHGFWNIHPTVYYDIAYENNYEILDWQYIDNVLLRVHHRERPENGSKPLDFDELPVRFNYANVRSTFETQNPQFNMAATARLFNNTTNQETRSRWGTHPTLLFDYCYIAMRKLPRAETADFRFPTQSCYRG